MASKAHASTASLYTAEMIKSQDGRTDISKAAAEGDLTGLERLVDEEGHSPSTPDSFLETPLHLASQFGHLEMVKVLIKEMRVDIDPLNFEGWTPLAAAVSRGHKEIVKYLLRNKANGGWTHPQLGWTLMHLAAWMNQSEMVIYLSQLGASASAESEQLSCRPIDLTVPGKTRKVLQELMLQEAAEDE